MSIEKEFNAVFRSELEQKPDAMGVAVLAELQAIESKASTLTKQGVKNIRMQLSPDIDNLTARIVLGNRNNAIKCYEAIEGIKQKFEADRDKNPNNELARIERAKLKINSMSNDEIKQRAIDYGTIDNNMSYEESQLILSRIDGIERKEFQKSIKEKHLDKPYLQTPEEHELLNNAERFNSLGGKITVDGMNVEVEKVLDLYGEMDREIN